MVGVIGRNKRQRLTKTAAATPLLLPAIFITASLLAACAILFRYSFNKWDPVHTMTTAVTLANYKALILDPTVRLAMGNTIRLSFIVTAICLLVGYPVAYGIVNSRWRTLFVFLLVAPLMTDVLLRAYGWLVMLGDVGLVNRLLKLLGFQSQRLIYNELSVVIEMIHEMIPLMVLPIMSALEKINPSLREAAENLGAGPIKTFSFITLPLSISGILAGSLLTFALSMSAFVSPLILGGGNVTTATILIQQQMLTTLNWPRGAAESMVLVALIVVILLAYRHQLRRVSGADR